MTKRATFVDRIAAAVPPGTVGLSLEAALGIVGGPVPYGRKAFEQVAAQGRARLVRRGRGGALFLVALEAKVLACIMCHKEFTRGRKSKRETCSKGCAIAYGWAKDPERAARRRSALSAAQSTPKALARTAAHNKRRWAKPGERERLAEQNRREWKNEEKAAVRAAKIRINHQKPEVRKLYSDIRKEFWKDPVKRKKMHDAAKASQKVQSYRSNMSEIVKKRWQDPVWRKKWTKANKARNTKELKAANSARMKARHAARRASNEASA